ncbi:MAG: isoprenylcysteine carboxylmethyltransferase family protein [Acidobacteriota bacterium]|nr:isoprenylcysteine carboxylmethyltransferase family protein [Acidobacteriota bacterium]
MSSAGAFFVRYRVRLGYPLAVAVLLFARPTPRTILYGALIGVIGVAIRAWAAGYLHKQEILTVTGPYAYTRNPLYFGSAILALGVAVASRSWISALILGIYFSVFYSIVMKKEEKELRPRHRKAFDRYAAAVPLFLPRLIPARLGGSSEGAFSSAQYKKNHEWQAAIGYVLLLLVLVLIWRFRTF